MKTFLLRFFTWWNGQTFGTQLWTWLHGELVGEDEFGNRYFRTTGGKIDPVLGFERRWVIYNGLAEGRGRTGCSRQHDAAQRGEPDAQCVHGLLPFALFRQSGPVILTV